MKEELTCFSCSWLKLTTKMLLHPKYTRFKIGEFIQSTNFKN
jgi:hypothetical protein